ncbi:ectoine hydroxylase [Mycolicibacter sinensis]|uniref:Ectoine hydroxylase n=1 Tax=Mycolicibacter sinensis (strain JDM601) TaxID=875328 RepID=A0A1A3TS95_MYCSD|nr:ectoine hydroxylase [Mycolicibacter sinensis]MDD7813851.1 ectoine hydroxylase [Mycobacterium sp. CSUR Q5927]OBK85524.1 ectoine hydroxylase [Mycolicibacter sinensis]
MTTAVTDHYPTRNNVTLGIEPRQDPVVWGTAANSGPLPTANVEAFDANGFLAVDALVDADVVADLRNELDRLRADPVLAADERSICERDSGQIRSIFEVHRISPAFAALVADPRLVGPVRQLLGSEVYVHQSRVNFKPGFNGREFYWHSDFETWHAEDGMPSPRAISVSVALTENLDSNGSLMIMPGSHRWFVSCPDETPPDHYRSSLKQQEIGTPDDDSLTWMAEQHGIRQITGPPGSAVFFDSNCMHGSSSNITPYPRSNVFIVYNSVENTLVEPFGAAAPRPTFVASRTFDPV